MAYSKARRLSDSISATGEISAFVDGSITHADLHTNMDLTGKTVLVPNASSGDSDTTAANTAFVQQEIAALVDSAPGTLNTLNELAAALGDDASFSTTVTNSIATKLPLAGGTLTGALTVTGDANPALEISRGSANTTNVNLKYNTTLTGQLSAADAEFQISAVGSSTPMEFFTNGSERMRIDSSGDVLIGQTSQTGYGFAQKLVVGDGDNNDGITIQSGSTHQGNLAFNHSDGTTAHGRISYQHGTNYMQFFTNNSEKMRIDSSGNVGIGMTPAPVGSDTVLSIYNSATPRIKLHNSTTGSTSSDGGEINMSSSDLIVENREAGNQRFFTNGAERFRIDSSGNVGIGTTGPNAPLEVSGGAAMSGGWGRSLVLRHNFPVMVFQSEYSTDAYGAIGYDNSTGMQFMVNSPSIDTFSSSQTPAMIILDNKNVGIGTVNPTIGKLQVHGGGASSSSTLHLQSDTSTEFNHSINSFNSNLTSGENNLFVLGKEGSTKNSGWIGYKWRSNASDTNQLSFGHWGNNNIVNILGDGKMGVGTETPDTTFHIDSGSIGYGFKNQSTHGHGSEGSNNSGYYHHDTDRGMYYWNKACYANGGFHTYSDSRLKENVTAVTGALDKVALMNGVTFTWDNSEKVRGPEGKQFGVLAQNMLEVDSELPTLNADPLEEQNNIDDSSKDTDYYSMDYARLTPYFIEAIKELKTKLEAAEARITELEG